MKRRLLQITLFMTVFFAVAVYGLAGVIPPHECGNGEIWQYSCKDPGPCTNACAYFCPNSECYNCCLRFTSHTAWAECMGFCNGGLAVSPAEYLAD
jgi:hypothetical protein